MAISYAKLAASTLALLKTFGTDAQLGDGTSLRTVTAVRSKEITQLAPGDSDVELGDVEYILGADANPLQSERFSFPGDTPRVLTARPKKIAPAGVIVAWKVWGRNG